MGSPQESESKPKSTLGLSAAIKAPGYDHMELLVVIQWSASQRLHALAGESVAADGQGPPVGGRPLPVFIRFRP